MLLFNTCGNANFKDCNGFKYISCYCSMTNSIQMKQEVYSLNTYHVIVQWSNSDNSTIKNASLNTYHVIVQFYILQYLIKE